MRLSVLVTCLLLAPAAPRALLAQSAERAAGVAAPDFGATRLLTALPAELAMRIVRLVADAREHRLPGDAIESAALELHAKGAPPSVVERRVTLLARMLADAQATMTLARDTAPSDAELSAAAAAIARGVTRPALAEFVHRAPRERDLALPLFVVSSLVDRGLAPRDALGRVAARLEARATDDELLALPEELLALPVPSSVTGPGPLDRWRGVGVRGAPAPAVAAPAAGRLGAGRP